MLLPHPVSNLAKFGWRFAIVLLCLATHASAATVLPVGPITFSANADYDSKFKESPIPVGGFPTNGISRNAAGYLSATNLPTSLTVFDTSATGGSSGSGGTGGNDANNDLSNFMISANFANSLPGIGGGFLLRLNGSEAGGYAAVVHNLNPNVVVFDVYEGASMTSVGFNIFSTTVVLPIGFSVAANTFYELKLTVVGGNFQFDFANGKAQANFTDFTVSATVGQVGVIVDTLAPGTTAQLDNFRIQAVPEPSSIALTLMAGATGLTLSVSKRKRSRVRSALESRRQ